MRLLHGVFTAAIRIKGASDGEMASMVAPPGGSINYGKLEKIVEKYAKIMEVLISELLKPCRSEIPKPVPSFFGSCISPDPLMQYPAKPEVENPTWRPPKRKH